MSISEDMIMRGYDVHERVEPCVCGGFISALDGDWRHVASALRLHYSGSKHQLYRQMREQADAWPTFDIPFDDLSRTDADLSAGRQLP